MSSIQSAQRLFDSGQYYPAANECLELIQAGQNTLDVNLLFIKSSLFQLDSPMHTDLNQRLQNEISNTLALSSSLEELKYATEDFIKSFNQWHIKTTTEQLNRLVANPTFEQWRTYYPMAVQYVMFRVFVSFAEGDVRKALIEKLGISQEDSERFSIDYDSVPEEEIKSYEYAAALTIFENLKTKLNAYGNSHVSAVEQLVHPLISTYSVADLVFSYVCSKAEKEGIKTDNECEQVKSHAELKKWYLEALIYPNGQAMNLLVDNAQRLQVIGELQSLYNTIDVYDPLFVAPSLPSSQGIRPQSSSGSGGCYVATAVYGSYDCPQVWTLRRFRDDTLAETWYGRVFIRTYYAISPTLVKWFGDTSWFKSLWKPKLDRMVKKLNNEGVSNTPYQDRNW